MRWTGRSLSDWIDCSSLSVNELDWAISQRLDRLHLFERQRVGLDDLSETESTVAL